VTPVLRAWLHYHVHLGVRHFVLVSNECDDAKHAAVMVAAASVPDLNDEMAKAKEAERMERIAHLKQMAAKRLANQKILQAWGTWVEQSEIKRRQAALLANAAGRMRHPKLAASLEHWYESWVEARRAAEMRGYKQQVAEQVQQRQAAERKMVATRIQFEQTRALERIAAEEERSRMRKDDGMLDEARVDAIEEARRSTIAAQKAEGEAMATAERAQGEVLLLVEQQKAEAQRELQRLLERQRLSFEEQVRSIQTKADETVQTEKHNAEHRRAMEGKEATKKVEAAEAARDKLARKMEEMEGERARLDREVEAQQETIASLTKQLEALRAKPRRVEGKVEPKGKVSMLGYLDIDEDSDKSIVEQMREALQSNAGRVIDLFREWDTDRDGTVTKKEFRKAMPMLGLDAPKKDIDELFDSFDNDGGGSITYDELKKILGRGTSSAGAGRPSSAGTAPPLQKNKTSAKLGEGKAKDADATKPIRPRAVTKA